MRRKNMLALGMSLVFCATATAVPLYANPLDHQERTVSEEKETSENQAENSVVATVKYKNTDSEEGSKESLANFSEETKNSDSEEAMEAVEETENTEASTEDIESTEENSMVKPLSLGYSGFRMANANGYKILTMNLGFGKVEYAARDHMKVVRKIPLKVSELAIRGKKDIVGQPSEEICKVLPDRIVKKKLGGVWTVYTQDYFTPGEYRYIYTLAMGKNSPYYFLPQETPDNDIPFTYTTVVIGDRFQDNQSNSSILVKYSKSTSASGKDPNYKYYSLETDSFFVKEAKKISKVYLNSSFDIHKAKVGDPMNSVTLNVEKIVLKNGTTVLNPGSSEQPFLINMYGDYSNDLNRFRLFLESYTNAAGENGNVRKAPEGTPLPAGRYQVRYLVQPNFMIDKYRFLVEGTDDSYGDGTEFYVNNERYINKSLRLQEGLTAGAEVLSPYFEPAKVAKQKNYSGSSGGSSSSSGSGGSGGSSGGGSGSFKVSSSFSGQVLGVDRSLSGGQWIQDEKGWWYKRPDGSYPKNSWGYEAYNGKSYWYYFLDSGYMATGWVEVNGSKYYLFPNSDGWKGRMLTGWQWIDGNCYYLDPQGQNEGALYRNTTTPDGYAVDAEGRWVVNGAVQKQ